MQKGFCVFCDTSPDQSGAGRRGEIFVKYIVPTLLGLLLVSVYYVFAWRPVFKNTPGLDFEAGFSAMFTRLGCLAVGGGTAAAGTVTTRNPFSQLLSGNSITKLKKGFDTAMKAKEKVANMSGVGPIFKVLAGFYQVISSFVDSFDVRWPDTMLAISQVASFCQFDVMTLPGTACSMRSWSYFQALLAQTLIPPIVIVALAIPSTLIAVVGVMRYGGVSKHPAAGPTFERFFQSMVLFLFIIYPALSRGVFTSFNTVDYGKDGRYIKFDHSGTSLLRCLTIRILALFL
jgi:hypothetical protein